MTRRERLERKAELRREWAEKRRAKAQAAFKRIDNAMRAGCESSDMADHHQTAAAEIENQLARSVFSDDPDAIEQLQTKIEEAEKLQERMKAANKIVRKFRNDAHNGQLALEQAGFTAGQAEWLFTPDCCGRLGFPDYETKNNNANIRRMKQRVQAITATTARKEAAEQSEHGVTVEGDAYVRVTFSDKPDRSVLDSLKAHGFCWRAPSWIGKREAIPDCVRELAGVGSRVGSLKWWATERTHGVAKCKAIVRCGNAFIWPVGSSMAAVTEIDNGRWMDSHDFTASPWRWVKLTDSQRANFEAAARDCYCYQGVDRCDFCTSTRTPDGAPWSSGDDFQGDAE